MGWEPVAAHLYAVPLQNCRDVRSLFPEGKGDKTGTMLDWFEIKRLARGLNLPAICEDTRRNGHPCLLAHGRLWTWWDLDQNAPGFRLPAGEREFLIACEPDIFYVGRHEICHNHVFARPERVNRNWVMGNLSLSWRALAPQVFVDQFPGEGPPVPQFADF